VVKYEEMGHISKKKLRQQFYRLIDPLRLPKYEDVVKFYIECRLDEIAKYESKVKWYKRKIEIH